MTHHRLARRGTGLLAVLGLVLTSFLVISGPAQAAPGDATISATPSTNLDTVQIVSLSGNAGPLGGGDTSYPTLHLAMCRLPLTATSCDTSLTNYGTPSTNDGNPNNDPHIVDVDPAADGSWGPVNFTVRKTIKNGDGVFECGTGANQCVVGSADAPVPTNHSYDATVNITFKTATITPTPTNVTNGQVVTVNGASFPLSVPSAGSTQTAAPQGVYLFQCALPITGASSCDGNPAHYGTATVGLDGTFSAPLTFVKTFGTHNCAIESCIVATIKNPPGAPDMWSKYGATPFVVVHTLSISAISGQAVTTHARTGNVVSFAGSNWGASLSGGTAQLCDVSATTCSGSQLNTVTVASDTNGDLTGTVATVDVTATVGAGTIKVTLGAKTATVAITVLGAPSISATPSSAGTGIARAVSGSNWDPNTAVNLTTVVSSGSAECVGVVTADASGNISGSCTPTNLNTTDIRGDQGALNATGTLGVTGDDCQAQVAGPPNATGCSLFEDVDLTVLGGDLHLWKVPGRITMSTITLNGHPQQSHGTLQNLRVIDARGGLTGWTLSGAMSSLTNGDLAGNNTIPASNMTWAPTCAQTDTTAPVGGQAGPAVTQAAQAGQGAVSAGTSGAALGAAQTLCTVGTNQAGGDYNADADLTLDVPAFQNRGTYHGVLTLTLI